MRREFYEVGRNDAIRRNTWQQSRVARQTRRLLRKTYDNVALANCLVGTRFARERLFIAETESAKRSQVAKIDEGSVASNDLIARIRAAADYVRQIEQ